MFVGLFIKQLGIASHACDCPKHNMVNYWTTFLYLYSLCTVYIFFLPVFQTRDFIFFMSFLFVHACSYFICQIWTCKIEKSCQMSIIMFNLNYESIPTLDGNTHFLFKYKSCLCVLQKCTLWKKTKQITSILVQGWI